MNLKDIHSELFLLAFATRTPQDFTVLDLRKSSTVPAPMQSIFWKRGNPENPIDPYPVGIKVLWKPDPPAIPSVE
jgi:hypothetical protein